MYEWLIAGGEVVDGTGAGPRPAGVAIRDGRVAAVGDLRGASARRTLDASGLYVCPGFIDMHSHADLTLLADPRAESKVRQGVTLDIAGNCGTSAAPIGGASLEAVRSRLARWGLEPRWRSMGEYLSELGAGGLGLHYACFVGHGALRATVMGNDMRPPTAAELARMKALLAESLEAGALGLSTGLIYPPGSYADREELVELCRVVASHDGLYSTHMRDEGMGVLGAIDEAIDVGRRSGARVQISHLKIAARPLWGSADRALARIEAARAEGLDVWADQYPYTASSTTLGVFVPQWAQEGGRRAMLRRLAEPASRARICREIAEWRAGRGLADPEQGWESVAIANAPATREWEGRNLREIARELGVSGAEAVAELLLRNDGDVQVVIWSMDEGDVRRIMRAPYVVVGSDSATSATDGPLHQGKPHPRGYGTFPRVLGRYCRDEGALAWGEAVHKMTGLSARRLGLADRGVVAPGAVADLALLDPARLAERATYECPHAYPDGVPHVMVAGAWVVRDGQHTGELPGVVVPNPRRSA
jgi:N-acyl-D-amino-acid deacylase